MSLFIILLCKYLCMYTCICMYTLMYTLAPPWRLRSVSLLLLAPDVFGGLTHLSSCTARFAELSCWSFHLRGISLSLSSKKGSVAHHALNHPICEAGIRAIGGRPNHILGRKHISYVRLQAGGRFRLHSSDMSGGSRQIIAHERLTNFDKSTLKVCRHLIYL